jgi:cytochrome oxidase Cu insertion factor (SCO1/SenC/PrrC family)
MRTALYGVRLAIMVGLSFATAAAMPADSLLIDQFNRPVSARELGGHWLLVYFGYASCKEICPGALMSMTSVLNRLGPSANSIDPIFVTLDPAHDSPAVLREFVAHFHPRIRALTGTSQAVAGAAQAFNVPYQSSAALIDHGTLFYLVAPDGRVVQVLHPQEPIDDLTAAIRRRLAAAP